MVVFLVCNSLVNGQKNGLRLRTITCEDELSQIAITSILQDGIGYWWLGTFGGLNPYDGYYFKNYGKNPKDMNSINNNNIAAIYEDHESFFWVATDYRLNKFDRDKEQFTRYSSEDVLPNNFIYTIVIDSKNNIWVSTNNGLSILKHEIEEFRNYHVADGSLSEEFNGGSGGIGHYGSIFLGGLSGFNIFHPDSIRDSPYAPPIVITDFQLCNESMSVQNACNEEGLYFLPSYLSELEELTLSHNEMCVHLHRFSIHFLKETNMPI